MALPAELRQEALLGAFTRNATYDSVLSRYFPPVPNPNGANLIKYDVLEYNKAMAPLVAYGAKAPKGEAPIRKTITFEAPTYKEAIDIPPEVLKQARDVGSLSNSEVALIAQALNQARLNMQRRWDWLMAQWLHAGQLLSSAGVVPSTAETDMVYFDSRYSSKTGPSGTALGFLDTHIDGAVEASWATATTDIKTDLDNAQFQIAADSGLFANRVLMNSATFRYILANTKYEKSEWYLTQQDQDGRLRRLWGYEFDIIDAVAPFDAESMATDSGGLGYVKLIPDNVVILTVGDNQAAGRGLVECKPSDSQAPENARGLWVWRDAENEHPHGLSVGVEWTGAPMITNPDATYIFKNVTSTS